MTDAELAINHLNNIKTWVRFATSAEIRAIDDLLATIPDRFTTITEDQYCAIKRLSDAIWDRFSAAPEFNILQETAALKAFLSDDDRKTVGALHDACVRAPLTFEQFDTLTTLLTKARRAKVAGEDHALLAEIKRYRNNFYLDAREISSLDNWRRDLADPRFGTLTSNQRHYANETLRRAKQRQREGRYILPPKGMSHYST
jgi:hypothetical protein